MIDGGSASLAVVYSDGDREMNVGTVVVDPTLTFKTLLSLLSQRIGISPHQLSVYLAAVGTNHKTPVTAKVNLAAVHRNAATHYFFVKRSKRAKKASGKDATQKKTTPEKVMLLRRATAVDPPFRAAFPAPIIDRAEYERRLWNFHMERESFLMNMSFHSDDGTVGMESRNGDGNGAVSVSAPVCEECLKAKSTGIDAEFHLCVLDKETKGFRSTAGPVSRPARKSGKDDA